MPLRITAISLSLLWFVGLFAQDRKPAYLISFTDKDLNAEIVLSQAALDRRAKYGIALDDLDLGVKPSYIERICEDSTVQLLYPLKWKNAIVVASDSLLEWLELPFVKSVNYVGLTARSKGPQEAENLHEIHDFVKNTEINTKALSAEDYGLSQKQVKLIAANRLHQMGFSGKGVNLAVFDAGFQNMDVLSAFAKIRGAHQLYSAYDLVDRDNLLTDTDNHGTAVSSCIMAYDLGKYIGTAPGVNAFLFRTEHAAGEDPLEELNWCRAAEIADSLGIDIVSSSLGYTTFDNPRFNYSQQEMDGKSSFVSQAAQTLFYKGVIVVNSAGNEGDDPWFKIGSPADVPDVIAVGAVSNNGKIGDFSSRGNNADGITKPDVCATGVKAVVASTYGTYYKGYGTSYATPILSGGIALLMEAFPNKSPKEITDALRITARKAHRPDSIYGYGLANLYAAYIWLSIKDEQTKPYLEEDDKSILVFKDGYDQLSYALYEHRRFLFIFNRLHKIEKGRLTSDTPFTYLKPDTEGLDCSKKYTIKIKLRSAVDNYKLKHNDLSFCGS